MGRSRRRERVEHPRGASAAVARQGRVRLGNASPTLAITQSIVEAHHATIQVACADAKVRFTIVFRG
jgi:hypothetical protein